MRVLQEEEDGGETLDNFNNESDIMKFTICRFPCNYPNKKLLLLQMETMQPRKTF